MQYSLIVLQTISLAVNRTYKLNSGTLLGNEIQVILVAYTSPINTGKYPLHILC